MITTIDKFKLVLENRESRGTIYFRNFTQKVLWDNELSGQISDGMWENSRNSNWEFWCSLETEVDMRNPRVDARTNGRTNFNLASPQLLEIVGDRMLAMAKMSKVTDDEIVCKVAEYLEGIKSEEDLHKCLSTASQFFQNELNKISDSDFQKWLKVEYNQKDMRNDLKDMIAIMQTVNGNQLVSKMSNNDSDDKDTLRIKGIIDKAKGDKSKEIQLATIMANSIDNKEKANNRANAATKLNLPHIAEIFKNRANKL